MVFRFSFYDKNRLRICRTHHEDVFFNNLNVELNTQLKAKAVKMIPVYIIMCMYIHIYCFHYICIYQALYIYINIYM